MNAAQRKTAALVLRMLDWFREQARDLPWRRTRDPYGVWVSEIMLQQTQVATVIPFWERWMRQLPTIQSVARAAPGKIHKLWEGLGYYTRVRNLQRAAQRVLEEHAGVFPNDYETILALPGIGRYTAGAICSIAFDQPRPILDGNVVRVLTRLYGLAGNPKEKPLNTRLWHIAEQLVKAAEAHPGRRARGGSCSQLNQSLMELGALICIPRQPRCDACPVASSCVAKRQGRVESLPTRSTRFPVTQRRFVALVLRRGDKFLVRQRPVVGVNAHLWEFPNVEVAWTDGDPATACRTALGFEPARPKHLCTIRHSITRYRIQLDAFAVEPGPARVPRFPRGSWRTRPDLRRLPFTSAHKKIIDRLRS